MHVSEFVPACIVVGRDRSDDWTQFPQTKCSSTKHMAPTRVYPPFPALTVLNDSQEQYDLRVGYISLIYVTSYTYF
jgi:hypothetical protein